MAHDTIPRFSAMLRSALDDLLAPEATTFIEMFDEDGVMEFPFAAPGGVERLEGREQLINYLDALGGSLEIERISAPVVHRTIDPLTVVLEFDSLGHSVATGRVYEQRYISVIRAAEGHIIYYRDYWNPLVVSSMLEDGETSSWPKTERADNGR